MLGAYNVEATYPPPDTSGFGPFNPCGEFTCVTCYPELNGVVKAMQQETIVTDSVTGGQKGSKPNQMSTLDPLALGEVGTVGGFGAQKYERYNFLKGYRWSLSYDALQRHLQAFWSREDNDPESGLRHLAHAAWHCLALISFQIRGLGTDDRPPAISKGSVPLPKLETGYVVNCPPKCDDVLEDDIPF